MLKSSLSGLPPVAALIDPATKRTSVGSTVLCLLKRVRRDGVMCSMVGWPAIFTGSSPRACLSRPWRPLLVSSSGGKPHRCSTKTTTCDASAEPYRMGVLGWQCSFKSFGGLCGAFSRTVDPGTTTTSSSHHLNLTLICTGITLM